MMEEARAVGAEDFATSLLHELCAGPGHDRGLPQDDDLILRVVDCPHCAEEPQGESMATARRGNQRVDPAMIRGQDQRKVIRLVAAAKILHNANYRP
jgi:hypothetical protein